MRAVGSAAPPDASDVEALGRLREALAGASFTADRVEAELGTHELSARPADIELHRRRLSGRDAFSTLARLFLLGAAVDAALVDEAAAPGGVEGLERLGLVAAEGSDVRATVRLVPHGEYFVASDGGRESGDDVAYDHVPGIQSPSVTLAKLAVRRHRSRAADVGTGCGIQALLLAKHAEHVVATDTNPRALAFAAFNTALNGIDNVELRLGGGFEPLEGDRFDVVVSNPPYVISPDAAHAYRDSGLPADELCRQIVQKAPQHLEEGGFAHLLVSWAHAPEGDPVEPLRAWVDGRGCDAWLLHYRSSDPLTHAAGWLQPLAETDPQRYAEALDRWVDHLRRLEIERIGYGAVVLRRRAGKTWVRNDPLPLDRLEPASEHTLRVFAGQDALERWSDDELLDTRLELTPHHRLQQTLVAAEGRLAVEAQTLELTDGLRFTVGVDRYTAGLLPHLDGRRPLRDAIAAAAQTFALDVAERTAFEPAALPVVRRLLALGFLRSSCSA